MNAPLLGRFGTNATLALMKTLIITGNDASAGCLKAARRSDAVIGLWPRLIVGPPPDQETVARIFGPPDEAFNDAFESRRGPVMHLVARGNPGVKAGLKALCQNFDRIELWFDPDAESQLALTLMLTYLQDGGHLVEKLILVNPESRVGGMTPQAAAKLRPLREAVRQAHLKLAARVWAAWQSPTPEDFADLLKGDISGLPYLERSILRLLNELPSPNTGLGASEVILLKMVAQGEANSMHVLSRFHQEIWPGTYTGFDAGQLLDDLSHAAEPAILGLPPGPYDMALMDDEARRSLYFSSPLTLSAFGQRLLDGKADFARAGPSHRWWGGTMLTSARQWRWDADTLTLHSLI